MAERGIADLGQPLDLTNGSGDTLPSWKHLLRSFPARWRAAIQQESTDFLCEEIVLSALRSSPDAYGIQGQALLSRLSMMDPPFHQRVTWAAQLCRYYPPGPSLPPSPHLQEAMSRPGCRIGDAYSLLDVLGQTEDSLLRRAAPITSAALWPRPERRPRRVIALRIASGPYHGLEVALPEGQRVGVGRVGQHVGTWRGSHLSVNDRSVEEWPENGEGDAPVSFRCAGATLQIVVRRGEVRLGYDLWDVLGPGASHMLCLDEPATLLPDATYDMALQAGQHGLRIGSTRFVLLVPSLEERRQPRRIYLSSAKADEEYRSGLMTHLAVLGDRVDLYHRRLALAGTHMEREAERRLDEAELVLFLISADHLADPLTRAEAQRATELERLGKAKLLRVMVRPVAWEGTTLYSSNVLPGGDRAISLCVSPGALDAAWMTVIQRIRELLSL